MFYQRNIFKVNIFYLETISQGELLNEFVFEDDAPYIYSSFMETYGIDLLTAKLHWWQFLALFRGLFIHYKDITSYRGYEGDDKEMLKARSDWQLSETQKGDKDIIKILLHGGDFTKGG